MSSFFSDMNVVVLCENKSCPSHRVLFEAYIKSNQTEESKKKLSS